MDGRPESSLYVYWLQKSLEEAISFRIKLAQQLLWRYSNEPPLMDLGDIHVDGKQAIIVVHGISTSVMALINTGGSTPRFIPRMIDHADLNLESRSDQLP